MSAFTPLIAVEGKYYRIYTYFVTDSWYEFCYNSMLIYMCEKAQILSGKTNGREFVQFVRYEKISRLENSHGWKHPH